VPDVEDATWLRSPIDNFILRRLESAGIAPAERADDLTLLRRIHFDLTGLPPTENEIETFFNDDSPDALRRVVDRLLASPEYGVRWGRHWLDVARYADSNGLDENLAFGNAWRYRDYVIDAFNSDKPFDQFVTEQIAGDLLPQADRQTRVATGFLALGAKVLAEPDREKLVMDTIDEQLDTLGKAFLGMTVGCVRCHDHKFDPLTQEDYYSLAAIFKNTRTFADTNTGAIQHWYEHSFADPAALETIREADAKIAAAKQAASRYKNARLAEVRARAREQAADYLAACVTFDVDAPLKQIEPVAEELGLHPRILHHCRRHLEFHRDGDFFRPWHRLADAGDVAGVRNYYQGLFDRVRDAADRGEFADGSNKQLADADLERARAAWNDRSGFLAVPAKPKWALDASSFAEYARLMEQARAIESNAPDPPAAMGVTDQPQVSSRLPVHIRGSHRNLGTPVPREFPRVMRTSRVRPIFPRDESGRLELARWMADSTHPLTARVFVNRVWAWHFGTGLVRTTENFGKLGDRPSHPDLLDWLATDFMRHGWKVKRLHRMILLSSTYQLSSRHAEPETLARRDPQNRLLARSPLRRLEAEPIRDAVLSVSGQLDHRLGGKTIPLRNRQFVFNHTSEDHTRYGQRRRRAAFLPIVRNNLYGFLAQFDYPDPTMPTGSRSQTVVAPQTLVMMNSELVVDAAGSFAKRLIDAPVSDRQRMMDAYRIAYCRQPTESEIDRGLQFVAAETTRRDRRSAWEMFCHGLLASNEFIYLR